MGARADAMSGAEGPELLPPRPPEGSYSAAGKSPDQIEADIVETRAELGEILDTIERRLAPRHLLERGFDMMKDTMSGEGGGFGETLRSHPVPLALIGMGVGWLMMSSSTRARLGEMGGNLKERVSGAAQSASGRAGAFAGQMRDRVAGWGGGAEESGPPERYPMESAGYAHARQKSGEAMGKARQAAEAAGGRFGEALEQGQQAGRAAWEQAKSYAGSAGDRLSGAGDRFGTLLQEHPLAMGALGFLAGAVVALLLPKSEAEERVVGGAGDALREKAADLGRDAAERARHVAERTVDAAAEAVKSAADEAASAAKGETAQATAEISVGTGEPGKI